MTEPQPPATPADRGEPDGSAAGTDAPGAPVAEAGAQSAGGQSSFTAAFREAAVRSAIARGVTGRVSVLQAMGGWLGIVEATLPSLAFLVLYVITSELWLSVAGPLVLGVVFLVVRLVRRDNTASAIGGILATVFSALLAVWTGQDSGYFLTGLWTNAAYGGGLLISVLVGWPLIGLLVGVVMGEGVAWKQDARKRRVFRWLTVMWTGLFVARLAVQLPLYLADDVPALSAVKLAMGIPLFAPLVVLTWLVSRGLYAVEPPGRGDPEHGDPERDDPDQPGRDDTDPAVA